VVWLIGGIRDLALVILTIALSWGFIHNAKHRGPGGGLHFPRDPQPDYWDFVYFAFGVGMAAQVADVMVTSKSIRRFVLFHSIVSFFFNVTLIAMAVSIVGDFISAPRAH
jgi:uncharacterized membrane protein